MNRTIVPQSVASWLFCALVVGLSPTTLGQPLPPLHPVNVSNFSIPFEIGGSAQVIREVELLVSKDRGRSWNFVARQPVESGKFAFHADADGEYWFAFRTITSAGNIDQTSLGLRVLVNAGNPAITPPPQALATQSPQAPATQSPQAPVAQAPATQAPATQSQALQQSSALRAPPQDVSSPIVPPRPERFRPDNAPRPQSQPMQQTNAEESKSGEPARTPEPATENEPRTSEIATIERATVTRPGEVLAPRFPGVPQNEPNKNREGDLLDDLLSSMSPFMDVQPAVRSVPGNQIAADRSNGPPTVSSVLGAPSPPPADRPAGSISYIGIGDPDTKPRIVVRWNTGNEQLSGAQIDVFRSSAQAGPRTPIAINLRNNGEYWWYLSPEDLNPFYIAVQIRSLHGGISVDVTRDPIAIDPRQLPVLQSQRQ
ncbi:MAG: hypothetical protein FWE95_09060 [Planctomycetaceae bacterium]|nr:hypothetical protein [Planctomycetaceae bacterium]